MKTEKYNLGDCEVIVQFEPKLIRIAGSKALLSFLSGNLNANTLRLVKLIKVDYQIIFGKPLKITNASLIVEIWGHLYASKFVDIVKELVKLQLIDNLASQIKKRSDTIDCGEADVDSNRKFWDLLSKFNKVITKFL